MRTNGKRALALLTAGLIAAIPLVSLGEAAALPTVTALKTEGRVDPVGVDTATPSFSWQMASSEIGACQKSYQVTVQDEQGQTVWDSGLVESSQSVNIGYEGEALSPASCYTWQVTVTDQDGHTVTSDPARFETSLLSSGFDAWEGAAWIGAGDLSLDAASKAVFHITAGVQLAEGTDTISFILGADDFRLENKAYNWMGLDGENYVRVELDLSQLTEAGGAHVNVYRCGYGGDIGADEAFFISKDSEDLNAVLTSANKYDVHQVDIFCEDSDLSFIIDGVELKGDTAHVNPTVDNLNTFPNMNSVGFAAAAGAKATITDYALSNGGRFATGTLLDQSTGATTAIFNGLEGITVEGNAITVEGGESGILVYADPSYAGAPMLRTSFQVDGEIAKARLYITAQGIYDAYLNGQEIAPEEWFNPGDSQYDAILGYNVYDVTDMLTAGENVMGAVLGEGWWTGMTTFEPLNNNYYGDQPALMAMLKVTLTDGTVQTVVTSPDTWQVCDDGPVRLASLFQGERYDATKEAAVAGWNQPGFDASAWRTAQVIETRKQFASPELVVRSDEPVHVIRTTTAQEALGEVIEGTHAYIYDMGENVSGVPIITIPAEYAKAGETITVRFAEILYPELDEYIEQGVNGLLMVENLRTAMVTDFYTMKEGDNVFAPDLTFHGYRYIEISGLDEALPLECVQMQVLSSLDISATYESSNELTNQLFENIAASTTSNYLSIPTDCPQRDERMGWTGDAQIFALSASYIADTYEFMRQWMGTVRATCNENGMSAQYAPAFVTYDLEADDTITYKGMSFGITWNSLVVTIPYNLYMQTGDLTIVEENYANACAYIDDLMSKPYKYRDADNAKQEDARLTNETGTLADHLSRVSTGAPSLGNAVYIGCLDDMAVLSEAMGETENAARYREAAAEARVAWNELFIDPETGKTRNTKGVIEDTQASYATPLRFNVISEENLPRVLEHYLRTITDPDTVDADGLTVPAYSITTGFNATGNVLPALSMNGLSDVAYRMFESTDYASWLYPVTQGATSIWERWNGYTNELGFNGNNSMNSFNHYSFGACYEWMMAYQLGIAVDPEQPGYQHFILQPTVGGTFTYASGSYDSAYGTIESGWTAADGKLTTYDATVPANTTATLYLEALGTVTACEGVTIVGETTHNGEQVTQLELVAGSWHVEVTADGITVTAK